MADNDYAKFKNDQGVPEIRIGVKKFKCAGASPPHDHPHIYLEMGAGNTIVCPYCVTLFRYDPRLGPREADPPDSFFFWIRPLNHSKRSDSTYSVDDCK